MAKDNRVSSTNTEPENGTSPAAVSCQLQDDKHVEPLYVSSIKGIDDITQPMLPAFEGRESESNWLLRYQHVHTLRCLAIGNAPTDFSAHYANTMESLLEGILKVVNSLRTTLCTSACTLLQEIVQAVKARADPWIDLLMNNLLKLCGSLKKLTSNAANETITVIIRNVSDNTRLITHILGASVDKNVRLRLFAPGWVKEIIQKPPTLEDGNDSSELHVAMKNGVTDPNPSVREYMRKVYWTYAGTWPERAQQYVDLSCVLFSDTSANQKKNFRRTGPKDQVHA